MADAYADPNDPTKKKPTGPIPFDDPNAPLPTVKTLPTGDVPFDAPRQPQGIAQPAAPPSLYESMQRRIAAVQAGQADPGNADLYGYNQTAGAAPAGAIPPLAAPPAPAAPAAADPAAAPAPPLVQEPAPTAPPAADPLASAFKDALMKQLTNTGTPSLDDPALKAQSDAYAVGQQRSLDAARSAMAERAAADGSSGVNSGAFDSGLAGLYQQQGENQAGFNANLVGNELTQQRNQLAQYAAIAGNTLSGEDARALQERIANLDAQIKREEMAQQGGQFSQSLDEQKRATDLDAAIKNAGIAQSGALGQGDLSLRDKLGTGGLNAQLLQLLMQNSQFGQNLGANVGMFNTGQQNSFLQSLLGAIGG
jgi:hypothetical protein